MTAEQLFNIETILKMDGFLNPAYCHELIDGVKSLQRDIDTAKTALDEADKRNLALSEQIDAMIIRSNAIAKYSRHTGECGKYSNGFNDPNYFNPICTCGFDDLMKDQS